jgi:hypothetical protein
MGEGGSPAAISSYVGCGKPESELEPSEFHMSSNPSI